MAKKITKPEGAPAWEDAPMVRLICIGRRKTTGGKLHTFWIRADGDGKESLGLSVKGGFVGKVIDLPMQEDGTYWPGQAKYVLTLPDNDERMAEWTAIDRAVFAEDEARKAEARAKRESDPLGAMTLDQLRQEMARLPHMQRVGLTATVLRYLG